MSIPIKDGGPLETAKYHHAFWLLRAEPLTKMKRRLLQTFILIASVAALAACSRSPRPPFDARDYDRYPGTVRPDEPEYVLNSGDQLELKVRRHEEFNSAFTVDKQGMIRLPLILEFVKAEGRTVRELEQQIQTTLTPYLVGEPLVELVLSNPKSRIVWVMGAVSKPGPYVVQDERLYLRMLIARAGFPVEDAALNRTRLIRSDPDRIVIGKIRLRDVLYWGDLTQNYEIRPGDVVWVPYTYLHQFVYGMRKILTPIRIINEMDRDVESLSRMPRVIRREGNDEWRYSEDRF